MLASAVPEIVGARFVDVGFVGVVGVVGVVAGATLEVESPPPPLLHPVKAALTHSAKVRVVSSERARWMNTVIRVLVPSVCC